MKTQQEWIDEVMDEFDYDKVQKVMEFLNWTWMTIDGTLTVSDLKRSTRKNLHETFTGATLAKSNFRTGTGGFVIEVEWSKDLDCVDSIELSFVLDSSLIFNTNNNDY